MNLDLVEPRSHHRAHHQPRLADTGTDGDRADPRTAARVVGPPMEARIRRHRRHRGSARHDSLARPVHHPSGHSRHEILDPINIVVALTLYTLALLVRVVADGPELGAARHGGRRRGHGLPQLAAIGTRRTAGRRTRHRGRAAGGCRVERQHRDHGRAAGIPQLGSLFTQGFQLRLFVPLVTGVVLCVVLAVVFDGLIIWGNKLLTPWRQRTVTS